jgi:hypothetical protein
VRAKLRCQPSSRRCCACAAAVKAGLVR